jgi:CO/xanthine dehydrogenase Mo-binding subunit
LAQLSKSNIVGSNVPRKEGRDKVTGAALYIDDMRLPGMLHGATVRSKTSRGTIREITFSPEIDWSEFIVVTAKDIPGKNCIALILDDQPCLADGVVNHPEEPVVLLAHVDKHVLARAVEAVQIHCDPLPAIYSMEESEQKSQIIWGTDNVFKTFLIEKGDVDSVWAKADHIVEGEYFTGAQEQLYIENNGMIAVVSPEAGVTVWGSLQCPFYVHKALMKLFGLPEEKIRVVQMETGGAFGGKEDYPSMLAAHAALLAMKARRPVKMIYDRLEDMVATTKRHPSRTRLRTAVSKDGKILGGEIDFTIDGGAYATLSSVVLSRGTIHAAGPYLWPTIRVRSKAVATNTPPHGAFRGFGAPQSLFALERHIEQIATVVGLTSVEIRRRNFLHQGDTTATEQLVKDPVDLSAMVDKALSHADYYKRKEKFARENSSSSVRRGVGFATFLHGAGFTGSGERYLASVVGVEARADGEVRVLVSSTEFGQGTNTVLCQVAAETLGVPYERVSIAQPDTTNVPNSGPTVASRTAMVIGNLVSSAANGLKQTLQLDGGLKEHYSPEEFIAACGNYVAAKGPLRSIARYNAPEGIFWDDAKYRGEAYAAYAWAVYVAEVSVDLPTYSAKVENFVALQEVGRVIHPLLARGQIIGGVAQGIGFALYEKVLYRDGRMINGQMTNYIMPASCDLPPIHVLFEEMGNPHGAFGAKGIGELPMDGPAPAIVNAIVDALGVDFNSVPLLAEDIFEGLHSREGDPEPEPTGASR